jgi:hypothetical protein
MNALPERHLAPPVSRQGTTNEIIGASLRPPEDNRQAILTLHTPLGDLLIFIEAGG